MTATTSPSKSSNTLAIDGGPKAVTGFEAKPEPKIGVEEFLAIAKRFGFTPEALKRLAATVSDADLLDAAFWQSHQARIRQGHVYDVFPYDPDKRFRCPADVMAQTVELA